jgi:hypothetical protein
MDNTIGNSITDVIVIYDDTDDDPELWTNKKVLLFLKEMLEDVKFSVDTAYEDPGKLWKGWTKNKEAHRKESEIKTRELEEDSKTKIKTKTKKVWGNKDEPELKRAKFIETVDPQDGTIRRREVCEEENLVEMVRHCIMAEKSAEEWNARHQACHSLLSRLPQMKEEPGEDVNSKE